MGPSIRRICPAGKPGRLAGTATASIAGLVLIGWAFDVDLLKRVVPGLVAMNPMSAVAFFLAAISLSLFSDEKSGERASFHLWLARGCALLVTLVGTAKLIALFRGTDIGVDQWLFSSKLTVGFQVRNVMAPNTAFNFLLLGSALLFLHSRRRRVSSWACICALISGFESMVAVLGYAYGIKAFYGIESYIPMALPTATSFLIMAYGIMSCQANHGFLAIITGKSAGGAMARRLLPAAILAPAILGWLRVEGQRLGFYDAEFGAALYTVTNMLVFAAIVCCNALSLFRTDSERTKAEQRLRRAHDELEAAVHANQLIMDKSRDVICTIDEQRRFVTVSAACETLWGYKPAEVIGRQTTDLVYPEDRAKTNQAAAELRASGKVTNFVNRYLRKDGSLVDVLWSASWSEADQLTFAVAHDITERKQGEEALRHSEERYRLLFESNPYPVWVYDTGTLSFLAVNEAAVHHYGYSEEEFLAMTIKDIRPTKDIPALLENVSKPAAQFEKAGAWRHRKKDGSLIDVEITSRPLSFGGKRARLVLVNDITDRKRAEDAIRESRRQLEMAMHTNQLIMDNSRDVICTVDEKGRFVTVSAACETLWGYKPSELSGQPYTDMVHPDDRERTNQAASDIMAGSAVSDFENRYIRKDGSLINVMWSAYWSDADKTMFAVAHDITERTRAGKALEQAKEEADRANRAKSEFLSRMSHELRTPMNAILGFAQLLEFDELSGDQREAVSHILRGGGHLLDLINEVLDLSRIEAGRLSLSKEPVAVGQALREALELVQPLAAEREVRLHPFVDNADFILADRQRLKQVLLNLLSNAIKYNRRGGSVRIGCEKIDNCLRIVICDTGPGIPESKLDQVFQPFQRLGAEQSAVEGTGLGLAVAKRLVEAMDGTMGLKSVAGEGSSFWIQFALAENPLKRADLADTVATADAPSSNGAQKVLYIEDNLSNLKLIKRVLSRRPSVELLSSSEGGAGLGLAREHRPNVILLDLNLPDMNGHDVLLRLRNDPMCAGIPVIVISADATRDQIKKLQAAGACHYLTKPLDLKKFIDVLDRTLQGHAADETQQPIIA
jgi:PAS domain S-box-containing protein